MQRGEESTRLFQSPLKWSFQLWKAELYNSGGSAQPATTGRLCPRLSIVSLLVRLQTVGSVQVLY